MTMSPESKQGLGELLVVDAHETIWACGREQDHIGLEGLGVLRFSPFGEWCCAHCTNGLRCFV